MFIQKIVPLALAAGLAGAALAQQHNPPKRITYTTKQISLAKGLNDVDREFLKGLYEGSMLEVEGGNLCRAHGHAAFTTHFGAQMVRDHTGANLEIAQLAKDKDVELPDARSSEHLAMLEKLRKLHGKSFDRAYYQFALATHRDAIALLNKEIAAGHDGDVESLAAKLLPTVRDHQNLAIRRSWMKMPPPGRR
jgi:putative membrane protein